MEINVVRVGINVVRRSQSGGETLTSIRGSSRLKVTPFLLVVGTAGIGGPSRKLSSEPSRSRGSCGGAIAAPVAVSRPSLLGRPTKESLSVNLQQGDSG